MEHVPQPGACDPVAQAAFDRVNSLILAAFADLVTALGGDPDALSGRVGIDPGMLGQQRIGVSYRKAVELVAIAAKALDCPDFGMRLAKLQARIIESPLRQVVRSSATLGEALGHVISHSYAHSLAAGIWLKRCPYEETVMVGHDILIDDPPDRRQAIEQILLVEYLTCNEATAGFLRARRVDFRHQAVSPPARYRAHFGCEVRFGQAADAIVYGEQALSCPIAAPNPSVCRQTIAGIDAAFAKREPPLHATVRGVVTHLLGCGRCSNLDVASAIGMHSRTLHRRLQEEGTSFQRIKNQVRHDLLILYLDQTDLPVSEISHRLGFAEQSALTRFCRQCLATSPSERRASAGSLH